MQQLVPEEQSSEEDTAEGDFSLQEQCASSEQSGTPSVGEKKNELFAPCAARQGQKSLKGFFA